MRSSAFIAAAISLAMPTIATPLEGSSALQARAGVNYIVTCDSRISNNPSESHGASLYTTICVKQFHCEHSIAPTLSSGSYVGACTNCPANIGPNTVGDCLIVKQ